jgi:hypothetical protein
VVTRTGSIGLVSGGLDGPVGRAGTIGAVPPPPGVRRKGITSRTGTKRRTRVSRDMGKVLIKRKRGIRLVKTLSAQSHAHLSFDTQTVGFPNPMLAIPVGVRSIPRTGTEMRGAERLLGHPKLATWTATEWLAFFSLYEDSLSRGHRSDDRPFSVQFR